PQDVVVDHHHVDAVEADGGLDDRGVEAVHADGADHAPRLQPVERGHEFGGELRRGGPVELQQVDLAEPQVLEAPFGAGDDGAGRDVAADPAAAGVVGAGLGGDDQLVDVQPLE